MNAIRLGVPRLRVLDAALEGALYEALRFCKDHDLAPELRVDDDRAELRGVRFSRTASQTAATVRARRKP